MKRSAPATMLACAFPAALRCRSSTQTIRSKTIRSPPSTTPASVAAIAARSRRPQSSAPRSTAPRSSSTPPAGTGDSRLGASESSADCSGAANPAGSSSLEARRLMNGAAAGALQQASLEKPLTIAILAMGGQGGGVLADWIVEAAERQGWAAQSTSVPGVAQRTGATLYYIETLPPRNGVAPVFSLMPTPGDVDVVMAAELMEAGRSVLRGLVTPEKTMLIASTHRAYAVVEKEKPGDGAGDPLAVVDALDFAARRIVAFDIETLAGSRALPFERAAYEEVVRKGGRARTPALRLSPTHTTVQEPASARRQRPVRSSASTHCPTKRPSRAQPIGRPPARRVARKRLAACVHGPEAHCRLSGRRVWRRLS